MELVMAAWHIFLFVAVVALIVIVAALGLSVVAIIVRAAVTSVVSPRKEAAERE